MNSIKAVIVDDEPNAVKLLNAMVETYLPAINVIATANNVLDAVQIIREHKPDLVFSDIEMPVHSGLELMDFFEENEIDFKIIFVTAYNQHAIQAIKLSALDYLLKPVDPEELIEAVNKLEKVQIKNKVNVLKENMQTEKPKKLVIHQKQSIRIINIDDIICIKADGAYSILITEEDKLIVSQSLKQLEEQLEGHNKFMRCHRSYIINTECVKEASKSKGKITLINGEEIAATLEGIDALIQKITS
jgi:two-component system LytT family response regulator